MLKRVSLSSAGSTACSQTQILSSFHSDNDIYVNLFHATARHLERPVPLSFTLSFHFDQRKCMCHEQRALDKQIDSMGGQGDTVSCRGETSITLRWATGLSFVTCAPCLGGKTVWWKWALHICSPIISWAHTLHSAFSLSLSVTSTWSPGLWEWFWLQCPGTPETRGARSCPSSPFRQWQPRACAGGL